MKALIILILITNQLWARSVVPDRIVTPPLDLFDRSNKVMANGDVEVRVTTYTKSGHFRQHGSKKIIPKSDFDDFLKLAMPVFQMIPDENAYTNETSTRRGTAFNIGGNLVLTNNHVLDPSFQNTASCADFQVRDNHGETFSCKSVHFCSPEHDVCLIEMAPKIKLKRECTFCSGTKYEISLAQRPALKLKLTYSPPLANRINEITTAIGNSAGYGIHLSQGQGVNITKERIYFYAPITKGNSGGPLLNASGEVIGVIKLQSKITIGSDPNTVYNVAAPTGLVISLIREALRDTPSVLQKFNQAVIE